MVRIGTYSPSVIRATTQYLHTSPTQPNASDFPLTPITSNNTTTEHIINEHYPQHEYMDGTIYKGHGETDLAHTNLDTFLISLDLRRLLTSLCRQ